MRHKFLCTRSVVIYTLQFFPYQECSSEYVSGNILWLTAGMILAVLRRFSNFRMLKLVTPIDLTRPFATRASIAFSTGEEMQFDSVISAWRVGNLGTQGENCFLR